MVAFGKAGYTAQMFACFLNLAKKPRLGSHYQDVLGMIDLFYQQTCGYEDKVRFAGSFQDYAENQKQGILSGFLTLEEGGAVFAFAFSELPPQAVKPASMTPTSPTAANFFNFIILPPSIFNKFIYTSKLRAVL